ncbi:hypothetical protein BSR29_00700 [Boudabousia liubingyangii]|uniref:HAD family phosphatase n=1 Tax=Boudabousia liubingyangii TaxID=1921764 RepID=A0A1Q5PPR1_9ACTO|nr:HAD family hydrolase [Boudabousia liubingyangii]OKL49513.1 hypothetical protein BSR29_00700 [Boudabousia liubingyangii]
MSSFEQHLNEPITRPAPEAHELPPGVPVGTFGELVEHAEAELAQFQTVHEPLPTTTDGRVDASQLLVALDIDGTILQADGTTSPRMKQAVKDLRDRGAKVVIASGRGPVAVQSISKQLAQPGDYLVCANGAVTIQLDSVEPFEYRIVDRVDFVPREALLALERVVPDMIFGVEITGKCFKVNRPFPVGELTGQQVVAPLADLLDEPVVRAIARAPQMTLAEFEQAVAAAKLDMVECAIGWTSWVDIGPKGVSKASALETLRQTLGLPQLGTIAFGDGWNDAQMLQWAHLSVAMGDAPQGVVDLASARAATVAADGVPAWVQAILAGSGTQTGTNTTVAPEFQGDSADPTREA